MLETFATQAAIALERAKFAEQAERARVHAESEQLRNSLLSSVSHDLRTPLAAITGAASTLLQDDLGLPSATRHDLLRSIHDEAARLNQFVGKLLDMTRLESAGMHLAREWFPLEDIVGSALTRLEVALRGHEVQTALPADLPMVFVDGVLLEEVFLNLLENACKYTPTGSIIQIRASQMSDGVRVEVSDNGPGLQRGTESQIFEKFVRDRPRTDRSGTGLGLAICRAVVHLHGGQIGAEAGPMGGASFWFTIPASGREQPNVEHMGASRILEPGTIAVGAMQLENPG
jgi:two-component system sensor histidine kinase KdpD